MMVVEYSKTATSNSCKDNNNNSHMTVKVLVTKDMHVLPLLCQQMAAKIQVLKEFVLFSKEKTKGFFSSFQTTEFKV